mgnify:CR=1 FL=1
MPILHLSQLVGVAAGIDSSELKFKRHVVSVAPVTEKLSDLIWLFLGLVAAAAAVAAWAWFEAGWLRRACVEVELAGVPAGARRTAASPTSPISISACRRAARRAVAATPSIGCAERKPDLVCVTGDLVSRRSGMPRARERLLARARPLLRRPRQPRLRATAAIRSRSASTRRRSSAPGAWCCSATRRSSVELRGRRVQIVGVDPQCVRRSKQPPATGLRRREPTLRILLCHFPGIVRRIPASSTSSSPGTCTRVRSSCRTPAAGSGSRTCARATSRASTTTARRSSTSRPVSARRSFPSGSSPGRR